MSQIKRIDESEAHTYISVEEDFTNSEAVFYTMIPDPEKPGWDKITYYTARRKNLYENREGDGDSWIYVLSNKTMPNLVKIGYTDKTPDKRAEQVSRGTGVPVKFSVEYAFRCFNAHALEFEVHKYLAPYRVNNDREFFQLTVDEAKEAIQKLGQRYL